MFFFGNAVGNGIRRGGFGVQPSPLYEWSLGLCRRLCSVTQVDLQGPVEMRLSVDYAYYIVFMCNMKLHEKSGQHVWRIYNYSLFLLEVGKQVA
jgi:hypothetical protein